ncbi:MAG: hypothetical protein GXO93_03155 [FCB group bacterium]|nr:hypothetical protein [FCB group bacterium]
MMIPSIAILKKELFQLLDDILQEEQVFKSNAAKMQLDDQQMEKQHHEISKAIGDKGEHLRLKMVHEAMFKVHHKIAKEHELISQKCLAIIDHLDKGLYNNAEIALVIEKLKYYFERMKKEHRLITEERKKIIEEHQSLIQSFNLEE